MKLMAVGNALNKIGNCRSHKFSRAEQGICFEIPCSRESKDVEKEPATETGNSPAVLGSRVLAVVVVLTGWVRLPRGWEAAPKMVARTSINCQADGRLVTR